MAQLTARETIEHHIGVLCAYLESEVSEEVWVRGSDALNEEYGVLVTAFWEDYKRIALRHGDSYYWTFCRAAGEDALRAVSFYAQDMWREQMQKLSERMKVQSVEALYFLTDEADIPEEYFELVGVPH